MYVLSSRSQQINRLNLFFFPIITISGDIFLIANKTIFSIQLSLGKNLKLLPMLRHWLVNGSLAPILDTTLPPICVNVTNIVKVLWKVKLTREALYQYH